MMTRHGPHNQVMSRSDRATYVPEAPEIFISYRRAESGTAHRLARKLQDAGCSVFIDFENICAGDSIGEPVQRAIGRALVAVAVMTKTYVEGPWAAEEGRLLRVHRRERNLPIIPVLDGADRQTLIVAGWTDEFFLEWAAGEDEHIVTEIVKKVEVQRARVASYHLPTLARIAAAIASRTPQESLVRAACPYVLPSATTEDQWYAVMRIARRGGFLTDLLSDLVQTTHSPWDPRTQFLRVRIGNPEGRDPLLPTRVSAKAAVRRISDAALDDALVETVRKMAVRLVARRFFERLDAKLPDLAEVERARELLRRVAWIGDDGDYRDREPLFCIAADTLLHLLPPDAIAGFVSADLKSEEMAVLSTITSWSGEVTTAILRELERELAAPRDASALQLSTRLERQLRRLRILADAGCDVSAAAQQLLSWAVAAGFEHRAVDVLQQSRDERVESYAALADGSPGTESFRILLSAIRRLVESGAAGDRLPSDIAAAVRAALPGDAAVAEVEHNERAGRMWLWMVGPELASAQRELLLRWAASPHPTRRRAELAAEAAAVLQRAGEIELEMRRISG
jgi:hypothetical protein